MMTRWCVIGALVIGVFAWLGSDLQAARVDAAATPQRVAPPPPPEDSLDDVDVLDGELNLENDDIGFDPDIETNYNVDRIEEITIPGPVMLPPGPNN